MMIMMTQNAIFLLLPSKQQLKQIFFVKFEFRAKFFCFSFFFFLKRDNFLFEKNDRKLLQLVPSCHRFFSSSLLSGSIWPRCRSRSCCCCCCCCCLGGRGLEIFVGGVLVSVHLHAGHVPLFRAGGLVHLDEALEMEGTRLEARLCPEMNTGLSWMWRLVYWGACFQGPGSISRFASSQLSLKISTNC